MTFQRTAFRSVTAVALLAFSLCAMSAVAQSLKSFLDDDAAAALQSLYSSTPAAKSLGDVAKGILVFPNITRAGFIVGVHGGDGVLFEKGKAVAHYSTTGASVGYQAGAQSYGYALFFLTDADLAYLRKTRGWSLGAGPNIVVIDAGAARDISTLTARKGVYAFIFEQKGLMAGVGLGAQKISRLN